MGIKNLPKIYNGDAKKGIVSLIRSIRVSELRGKRLVVDGNSVFYRYWSTSVRNTCEAQKDLLESGVDMNAVVRRWIGEVSRTLMRWKAAGVEVCVILDGKAPVAKEMTQGARQKGNQDYLEEATEMTKEACRIAQIEHQVGSICTGPLPDLDMRRLSAVNAVRARHRLCVVNGLGPRPSDWVEFATSMVAEGFQVIRANVEAETLCCKMVLNKEADFVYSTDCDCLAYRVPMWLKDWDPYDASFDAVYLRDVLDRLGLDEEQFLSYCILSGCDYNVHITKKKDGKDLKMGPVQIRKRLLKHGTIEKMMEDDDSVDWTDLNLDTCRSIFNLVIDVEPLKIVNRGEILV